MNHIRTTETAARRVTRCHACQLQICKSREASPHGALKLAEGTVTDDAKLDRTRHAVYLCQTCEAVLVHSTDLMELGWRQRR